MPTNVFSRRGSQVVAWAVAALFLLGFFFPRLGMWTGPILGIWFVGTQKTRRGFLWMVAFTFIPDVLDDWSRFPLTSLQTALGYLGWVLLVSLLGVLPFMFHRLVSPRLPGFLSTLPFPLAVVALRVPLQPLLHTGTAPGIGVFLVSWFAAVVVWMWNLEFRASSITVGASVFAVSCVLAAGFALFLHRGGFVLPLSLASGAASAWICFGGAVVLSVWAILSPGKRHTWADTPQSVARLRSPSTGNPLHVVREQSREEFISSSGERFPVRNGIPVFLRPEDLTGPNLKYNHLYETIGGFYDDIQRVVCALSGMDRNAYVMSYLGLLEVKPGDSVLETSVGTGLNFKYLPCGVKLAGLDLSPEMLANCQANLRRWKMDADLFLGNAESLPFADSSFDVVFHVGGINFFTNRAKAILEMIRVAKPGSLLLIADETEEHVKNTYERSLGGYFKGRKEAVAAPVDLVPPAMEEIQLTTLGNGRFYALTFRKPVPAENRERPTMEP